MLRDKEGNVLKKVYLDSASTYLKNWKIIKEVIGELEEIDANPHSNHTMGKTIKGKIEKVRKQIYFLYLVEQKEIIWYLTIYLISILLE